MTAPDVQSRATPRFTCTGWSERRRQSYSAPTSRSGSPSSTPWVNRPSAAERTRSAATSSRREAHAGHVPVGRRQPDDRRRTAPRRRARGSAARWRVRTRASRAAGCPVGVPVGVGERQQDREQRHVRSAEVHEVVERPCSRTGRVSVRVNSRSVMRPYLSIAGSARSDRRRRRAGTPARRAVPVSRAERDVEAAAGADRGAELAHGRRVGRERREELRLQAVDVRVHGDEPAVRADDGAEVLRVVQRAVADHPEVLPQAVDRPSPARCRPGRRRCRRRGSPCGARRCTDLPAGRASRGWSCGSRCGPRSSRPRGRRRRRRR